MRNNFYFYILKKAKWLVLGLFSFVVFPYVLQGQNNYSRLSKEESDSLLTQFQNSRLAGDFCMKFEILHEKRRTDEEKVYEGILWGTWRNNGALMRMEISQKIDPGVTNSAIVSKNVFLMQSGPAAKMWRLNEKGKAVLVNMEDTQPLLAGLIFSPLDLQTPFVYWKDYEYLKTERYKGRPLHLYKMNPPKEFREKHSEIEYIRLGFDRVYNVLMMVETYGEKNKRLKTFSLSRVKKAKDQYFFKELEIRDEITRDKDILDVKSVALNLRLPRQVFTPEDLENRSFNIPKELFIEMD